VVTLASRPARAPVPGPRSFAEVRARRTHQLWIRRVDVAVVGVGATVLGAVGSGTPSFWYDEAASVASADRQLPDLFRLLGTVDAVHGLYYLLLHGWFGLVGISEWTARFPSAVAVGFAAAGVVVLGYLLGDRRLAVTAGVLVAILPRTTWAATEARSSALTMVAAVWLTVLLVQAVRRPSVRRWAAYALGVSVSIVLFLYSGTLVAAHLVAVALLWRRSTGAALLAAAAGCALTVPFVRLTVAERAQVQWIPPLDGRLTGNLLRDQWFLDSTLGAVLAWTVLVAGLAAVSWTGLGRLLGGAGLRAPAPATVVAAYGALLPPLLLVAWSLWTTPSYLDRYLAFSTPFAAILLARAVLVLARRPRRAALLVGALGLAFLPSYLGQRAEFGKPVGMDYSAAADVLAARARPGDCILYGAASWNPTTLRVVGAARPDAVRGLVDRGLARTAAESATFWGEPLRSPVLDGCATAWLVTDADREVVSLLERPTGEVFTMGAGRAADTPEYAAAVAAGLHETDRTTLNLSQVIRFSR
jgi:mannosyltransferase